jgi:signal transduction histidine kinase
VIPVVFLVQARSLSLGVTVYPGRLQNSFSALSSFDQINLGSTLLQAVVALSFAAVQHGVASHFQRPAMRALAGVWRLLAIAAIVNIFSAWSGAVWENRELSRALNSIAVGLLAAAIPYVQSATDSLAFTNAAPRRVARLAISWGLAIAALHAIGVFGLGAAMPDIRVITVTYSRVLKLVVLSIPAIIAWAAFVRAEQHHRALRLLAVGASVFALRQAISVALGLRVGLPDLPFEAVVGAIIVEVLAIMLFGVMSLLANTAEELAVTERRAAVLREAEARLAAVDRMESLGRLAAGVAHDFNNVLHVIRLSAGSVQPSPGDPVDRGALDEVTAATKHGAAIVSQLLTFARQQPQDPKRFDVFERLRSVAPLIQRVAGQRNECTIDVANGMAIVVMDPAQFEQIAINLVSNARDAIGGSGRITVSLDAVTLDEAGAAQIGVPAGDYARFTVEDSGHGIPDEIRSRLFDPFFTTKPAGLGSGLGLSTVHGIVQRCGGMITVDSSAGRGARFDVYLPAVELVRVGSGRTSHAASGPAQTAALSL